MKNVKRCVGFLIVVSLAIGASMARAGDNRLLFLGGKVYPQSAYKEVNGGKQENGTAGIVYLQHALSDRWECGGWLANYGNPRNYGKTDDVGLDCARTFKNLFGLSGFEFDTGLGLGYANSTQNKPGGYVDAHGFDAVLDLRALYAIPRSHVLLGVGYRYLHMFDKDPYGRRPDAKMVGLLVGYSFANNGTSDVSAPSDTASSIIIGVSQNVQNGMVTDEATSGYWLAFRKPFASPRFAYVIGLSGEGSRETFPRSRCIDALIEAHLLNLSKLEIGVGGGLAFCRQTGGGVDSQDVVDLLVEPIRLGYPVGKNTKVVFIPFRQMSLAHDDRDRDRFTVVLDQKF